MTLRKYSDELILSLSNRKCELLDGVDVTEHTESGKNGEQYSAVDSRGREFAIGVYESQRDKAEDCASEKELLGFLKTKHVVRISGWEYVKLSKKRGCLVTSTEKLDPTLIPVSAQEAVKLGTQLAYALEECHRTGLLHLTITPADILSCDGTYKLDGFGTVRLDPSPNGFSAPEYAAAADFDHRADIYSLALSIFALLGGDSEEAPTLETCPPDCPEKLFAVLKKACSENPEERYSFARLFGKALERSVLDETEEEDEQETDETYEGNDGSTVFADENAKSEESDDDEESDDEESDDEESDDEESDDEESDDEESDDDESDDEELDDEELDDEELDNEESDDDESDDEESDDEESDDDESDDEKFDDEEFDDEESDDDESDDEESDDDEFDDDESDDAESNENAPDDESLPELWDSVRCSRGRAALDIIVMILAALLIMAIPALLYYFKNR